MCLSKINTWRSIIIDSNHYAMLRVRQMPEATPSSSMLAPKAPPKAKAKSVRDARDGALRTAHAAARGPENGDRRGRYTYHNGEWRACSSDGRWWTYRG